MSFFGFPRMVLLDPPFGEGGGNWMGRANVHQTWGSLDFLP